MRFRTHLAFALFIGLIFIKKFDENFLFLIIVLIGAILPDIDHPRSWIGMKAGFLSRIFNFIFGHRKWIHSVFTLIILSLIVNFLFGEWWKPFFLGYFSHLFIDGLTIQGINFIYPFKQLRLQGFIESGKILDEVLFFILLLLDIILFYILFF